MFHYECATNCHHYRFIKDHLSCIAHGSDSLGSYSSFIAIAGFYDSYPAQAATARVSIVGFAFNPSTVTINVGDTVIWTAQEADHTVTSDNNSFDSSRGTEPPQTIPLNGTFTHTFTTVGSFRYFCRVHGAHGGVGMIGTIVVRSNASPAPTISNFSPLNSGLGSLVTIRGSNFVGTTAVRFNGIGANFIVNSPMQIMASVPAGASTGLVSVTTLAGTANSPTSFVIS